ncbi:MAG TPA: hypothetical protein VMI94_29080 [Bryobacteraceae bacterium]|nr:hypothetical protein [Bryobacteraceae bacterium]
MAARAVEFRFEGRYLRQVGVLYAELDEWRARISQLEAKLRPSAPSEARAEEARERARQTYEQAQGEASEAKELTTSPELKSRYREAAKRIHPDFATDPADRERRTRFMAEANRAYKAGDDEALKRILDEYEDGAEAVTGEGIGAELIRIIRQISEARQRISVIEREIADLLKSDIAQLTKQAEEMRQDGRDLLNELVGSVRERIELAKKTHDSLLKQEGQRTA